MPRSGVTEYSLSLQLRADGTTSRLWCRPAGQLPRMWLEISRGPYTRPLTQANVLQEFYVAILEMLEETA